MSDARAIASIGDIGITRVIKSREIADSQPVVDVSTHPIPADTCIYIRTNKERGVLFKIQATNASNTAYVEAVGAHITANQPIWVPPMADVELYTTEPIYMIIYSSKDDNNHYKLSLKSGGVIQRKLRNIVLKTLAAAHVSALMKEAGPTILIGGPYRERNYYIGATLINQFVNNNFSPKLINLDNRCFSYPYMSNLPESISVKSFAYRTPALLSYILKSYRNIIIPCMEMYTKPCLCEMKEPILRAAIALSVNINQEFNKDISDIYIKNVTSDFGLGKKYLNILAADDTDAIKDPLPPPNLDFELPQMELLKPFGKATELVYADSRHSPHIVILPAEIYNKLCPKCERQLPLLLFQISLIFHPDLYIDTYTTVENRGLQPDVQKAPPPPPIDVSKESVPETLITADNIHNTDDTHVEPQYVPNSDDKKIYIYDYERYEKYIKRFECILYEACENVKVNLGGYYAMSEQGARLPFIVKFDDFIQEPKQPEGHGARYHWLQHFMGASPLPEQVEHVMDILSDSNFLNDRKIGAAAQAFVYNVPPSSWNNRRVALPISFWNPAQTGIFHVMPSKMSVTAVIGQLDNEIDKNHLLSAMLDSDMEPMYLSEICDAILKSRSMYQTSDNASKSLKIRCCDVNFNDIVLNTYNGDIDKLTNAIGYVCECQDIPFAPSFGVVLIESLEIYIDQHLDKYSKYRTHIDKENSQKLLHVIQKSGGSVVQLHMLGNGPLLNRIKEDPMKYCLIVAKEPQYPNRWLRLEEYFLRKKALEK